MKHSKSTFLVFGASGRTGQHFVSIALKEGHKVKALVRNPEKMKMKNSNLELFKGSITDCEDLDDLLNGVNFVICMLGNAQEQNKAPINTIFIKKLIPAMRRQGVKRFLYQAGGLTRRYKDRLSFVTWVLRNTVARYNGLLGQHKDNETVIEYLVEEAQDVDWIVHRAGIISDGPSKGLLKRDCRKISLATHVDIAKYNFQVINDKTAIHTCDLSCYIK
ncbi:NAD(P)H-binding protein [Paenibacillus sp. HB172176]|uniref:NAD(P)-dependent oxidoreductase n=1 Tax=Paenibacillus sp. HB172176 TaxID=2493690 RepID=UPI00143A7271|nr:NAD(P)H-binding protein [Paenibacillus sp. HB172176]